VSLTHAKVVKTEPLRRRPAAQARQLEAAARKLLARVGKFSEDVDSAPLCAALGALALAASNLAETAHRLERRTQE
jgi:hypothetical protein